MTRLVWTAALGLTLLGLVLACGGQDGPRPATSDVPAGQRFRPQDYAATDEVRLTSDGQVATIVQFHGRLVQLERAGRGRFWVDVTELVEQVDAKPLRDGATCAHAVGDAGLTSALIEAAVEVVEVYGGMAKVRVPEEDEDAAWVPCDALTVAAAAPVPALAP